MSSAARQLPVPVPAESWRSLLLLAAYRWVIVLFLIITYYSERAQEFFSERMQPGLFEAVILGYLLLCLPTTVSVLLRRPSLRLQLYGHAFIDVVTITALIYAAGGVRTGLGMMLLAPIAATSMLLPRRQGVLIGALATLALLGEEAWRSLRLDTETSDFVQAGMLGLLYLLAAWVANALSARASAGEALAARRKVCLSNV